MVSPALEQDVLQRFDRIQLELAAAVDEVRGLDSYAPNTTRSMNAAFDDFAVGIQRLQAAIQRLHERTQGARQGAMGLNSGDMN